MAPEDLAEYVRAYAQPGAVMGACNGYRAGQQDQAQDEQDADRKITCPLLALWADFDWVGQAFDVAAIWTQIAEDLRAVELPGWAHLPHEERPAKVNAELLRLLDGWAG